MTKKGMRVRIDTLEQGDVGATDRFDVALADPALPDLPRPKNLSSTGTITKIEDGLLVAGTARVTVRQTCARCLIEFDEEVANEFKEEYSRNPGDEQFKYEKDEIDLTPMLRTVLLLSVSDRPLHDPGCKGLCAVCGKDLNREPHRHAAQKRENPFSELKKLSK